MPRYIVVTEPCTRSVLDDAEGALTTRFPELAIESIQPAGDLCWQVSCDAPSDEHPRRWLSAAGVDIQSITPNLTNHPAAPES